MITRYSPSPTGYMHLGNLRTALLNYLMARANNGIFILRIDDTDQDRNQPQYIDYIYDQMSYFGLDHDVTFKQSDRLDRYKDVAQKIGTLTDNGYELDMGGYNMVIFRNNGYPTYNFCHIVDDMMMGVTHVLRSQEFISSTPKFLNLYEALEIERPILATLPFVMAIDGQKKLGKRDGAKDIALPAGDGNHGQY